MIKRKSKCMALLILSICLLNCRSSMAQTPQQIMANLYKAYDSIKYLSFNVRYTYTSDTLNGDFTHDLLEGSYTLAGKKAKFNLGDIEFMQNDSFFISVYNNDKFILVANPRNVNSGSELPMRQVMDSLIKVSQLHYTYQITNTGDTGIMNFNKTDSIAQFVKFTITYNTSQNLLNKIEYVFDEPTQPEPADSVFRQVIVMRRKRLKIEFLSYRFDNFPDSLYDENQYIYFDEGSCKPVTKYNDYRVFYSRSAVISD